MTGEHAILPYGRQTVEEDDIAAVVEALRGECLTQGPHLHRFEAAFAETVAVRHAVACSSGTAALHLAYLSLGVAPGDAVIVPAITFVATANAARFCGAEVVFADVDAETGLMEASHLQAAIANAQARGLKPKLAAPVHLAGQVPCFSDLMNVAQSAGLSLVEDACHAIGSEFRHGENWERVG